MLYKGFFYLPPIC